MSYLLDTNILSETLRAQPNRGVKKWLQEIPSEAHYISVVTIGEIRRGIEKLGDNRRKSHFIAWLEYDLPKWFGSNILPINLEIAERWGYITSTVNHSFIAVDTLLAATALTHNLKMVTRNVKDFTIPGLEVINPFE
ncbi:MAG TPA: type II toxin-antitoxin system VapC family toxin [Alphaproteobacteria bacterium]|nr:type II toxin-antitoxin system VapC family toxin [Alphaproteobacteria bacterium]